MKPEPVVALAQRFHALMALGEPMHVELLADISARNGVDWRDVLDAIDEFQTLYIYGPMVGLA